MISIVIPAYNAEKTICNCLESVLRQSAEAEIILVDDGSTDATLRLAENYGARVQILRLTHGGVSAARNAGLAAARGDWIAFLDADDALMPGALETLRAYMSMGVCAVCGGIQRGNKACKTRGKATVYLAGHALMDHVLADPTNYLTIHAWAFRTRPDMPCFDPALTIGEDSDWVLRYLSEAERAVFVSAPVYRYAILGDSAVHQWREGMGRDYLTMIEKISQGTAGREKNWPLFVLTNYLLILTHAVFHPAIPSGRRRQLQTARALRYEPVIADAFESADLTRLGGGRRVVLACLKRGWFVPALLAVKIRQRMNAAYARTGE